MHRSRRTFLASAAATGAFLSGCLGTGASTDSGGGGGDDGGDSNDGGSGSATTASTTRSDGPDESSNASGASNTLPNLDHPSAAALSSQPALGPTPGTVPTIIAFEDPSCTNCERFNENTFPKIESRLITSDEVSYVYRNFPYAFAWGRPAMRALEATFSRNEDAFWALSHHYFATQSEFSARNVLERTRDFLARETAIDAPATIQAVRNGESEKAVSRDVSAGKAAGVVSTPAFFLFRDGEFLTEVRGAQSYDVFAQALGV